MKILLCITLLISNILTAQTWKDDLEAWKTKRVTSLKKPHGWLSLIGMEWLHKGDNTIGSADDNKITLPHGPAHIGSFKMHGKVITFNPAKGVNISVDDKVINKEISVKMDTSGSPSVFSVDSFQFYVIERGKPALRIKDSQAQTRTNFHGIDYFDASKDFRVPAQFIAYTPEKDIEIVNVLGLLSKDKSPGKLQFIIDKKPFTLDVLDAGDDFYIIFADRTSGRTTYGPGRFLYVPKPKPGETNTIIDFNKAYNPPCAFTDYSTCPLPPPQNRIRAFIEAGEKKYHD